MGPGIPAIECRALTRAFKGRRAVDGLDLKVRRGTIMALVGSNGAGKTTFMKILATLLLPTSGQATILGGDVVADAEGTRRRLGFVPSEERSFYWRLTVRQNLEFFGAMHGLSPIECRPRIEGILEDLQLRDRAETRFGELSTGMKQCVGVARGLLHDPEVVLLDEPTRSLSPDMGRRVVHLLQRLVETRGKTVLVATHNLLEAQAVAHEVAVLHKGAILGSGPLDLLCGRAGLQGPPSLEALFLSLTCPPPEAQP